MDSLLVSDNQIIGKMREPIEHRFGKIDLTWIFVDECFVFFVVAV